MSVFDWMWGTRTIKNLGDLERHSFGIGGTSKSLLLIEKRGEREFVFQSAAWFLILFSARRTRLSLEGASKLREFIDESERIAQGISPRSNGPKSLMGEQVVADFGPVEQESSFGRKQTIKAILVEWNGKLFFELRHFSWFLTSVAWDKDTFTQEQAYELRKCIDKGVEIANGLPPSSYDPKKELARNCLLITSIGTIIAFLVSDIMLLFFVAWMMLMGYLGQTRIFKSFAKTGSFFWIVLPLSVLAGFIALVTRAILLFR